MRSPKPRVMRMKTQMRFEVHDPDGPLRLFGNRKEAEYFMTGKTDLHLVVKPKFTRNASEAILNLVDAEPALY